MSRGGHDPCMYTEMNQRSFASAEYAMKKKRTRREKFLADMELVVPWARLIGVIEPLYPTSGRVGRQPIGVPRMLRMYCLQQWYGLADEALEDALYDGQALRDFVGIDLSRESVPDATTLLKFRRLLLDNDLTKALFEEINAHLAEQGLLMRAGTIVDATIISAPSSTKNAGNARDPEMHQTKRGQLRGSVRRYPKGASNCRRAIRIGGPGYCILGSPAFFRGTMRRRCGGSRNRSPCFPRTGRRSCSCVPPMRNLDMLTRLGVSSPGWTTLQESIASGHAPPQRAMVGTVSRALSRGIDQVRRDESAGRGRMDQTPEGDGPRSYELSDRHWGFT